MGEENRLRVVCQGGPDGEERVGRDACQVSILQGYGDALGMLNCLIREERSGIDTY